MGPDTALPIPADFTNVDDYVDSLLEFQTSSWLLQTLCGGVHILDFYTRTPDLYSTILPEAWRTWFKSRENIHDILDLLMREDLTQFDSNNDTWRGGPCPPEELLDYIRTVRKHLLGRDFPRPGSGLELQKSKLARHVAVGMKVKKIHEVDNFSRYVDKLTTEIAASGKKEITHLADFGSGQNYLGRALAAPPYSKHIIAVESKQHNIEGAKNMDIKAKLVEKPMVIVNKKIHRQGLLEKKLQKEREESGEKACVDCDSNECAPVAVPEPTVPEVSNGYANPNAEPSGQAPEEKAVTSSLQIYTEGGGSVQYVEHFIKDSDLSPVIAEIRDHSAIPEDKVTPKSKVLEEASDLTVVPKLTEPNLMVISLHSCGNLVHHGLRSLIVNPAVSAVAMVGCCYNLMTERLGPPTYKLPSLRPSHPRLISTTNACDPHGFPMSERVANQPLPLPTGITEADFTAPPRGVRLNITARMMAVQAPFNWGPKESGLFFTRHFYRALLQRIFMDLGIVSAPVDDASLLPKGAVSAMGHTSQVNWTPPNGRGPGLSSNGTTTPITIGTLRKFAYADFLSYVRAAIAKLTAPNSFCEVDPEFIKKRTEGLTDERILAYEAEYTERKKELSVMWSLMAFSAGVVEAMVVTDRWLWLKEQEGVQEAWVEPVFEYAQSPRNLVVVGIKK